MNKEENKKQKNYVYIIDDGEFIKIGQTNDPERRLQELQTGNPRTLKYLKLWDFETHYYRTNYQKCSDNLESKLHACFKDYKAEGGREWFKVADSHKTLLINIESFSTDFKSYESRNITDQQIQKNDTKQNLHILDTNAPNSEKIAYLIIKTSKTYLDVLQKDEYQHATKTLSFYKRFLNYLTTNLNKTGYADLKKILLGEKTNYYDFLQKEDDISISDNKLKKEFEKLMFLERKTNDKTYAKEISKIQYMGHVRSLKNFELSFHKDVTMYNRNHEALQRLSDTHNKI